MSRRRNEITIPAGFLFLTLAGLGTAILLNNPGSDDQKSGKQSTAQHVDTTAHQKQDTSKNLDDKLQNTTPLQDIYTDLRGLKVEKKPIDLLNVKCVGVSYDNIFFEDGTGLCSYLYQIPVFETPNGYVTLTTHSLSIVPGLRYNVQYHKLASGERLDKANLFKVFTAYQGDAKVNMTVDSNIEGIIRSLELIKK